MPKMNHADAIDQMIENPDFGTSIFREGKSVVIAIGARQGLARCAYMTPQLAREMAQALTDFADEIDRRDPQGRT